MPQLGGDGTTMLCPQAVLYLPKCSCPRSILVPHGSWPLLTSVKVVGRLFLLHWEHPTAWAAWVPLVWGLAPPCSAQTRSKPPCEQAWPPFLVERG
nr:hypothetical protein CFP56_79499 [Quercus suber]